MRTVRFHLDFVSPYTWLALTQSARFAEDHGIRWEMRPVVFAALLDAHGLVGPAETEAKRRYTFHDVVRQAQLLELRFAGPPSHPFRSIEALRVLHLFRADPRAHDLAAGLSDACWGRGRDLADAGVRREVVEHVGLDADGLEERISAPEVKLGLRETTEQAIADGVFGVPTFTVDGELFWGHDRLGQLSAFLRGELRSARSLAGEVLTRPRTAQRRRS